MTLFDHLTSADVQWLHQAGTERPLAAGEALVERGDDLNAIYVVVDGLLSTSPGFRPGVPLGPGEVIGEFSFLDGHPASAAVTAVEDSRVLRVQRSVLTAQVEKDPAFGARFYKALGWIVTTRLRRVLEQQ